MKMTDFFFVTNRVLSYFLLLFRSILKTKGLEGSKRRLNTRKAHGRFRMCNSVDEKHMEKVGPANPNFCPRSLLQPKTKGLSLQPIPRIQFCPGQRYTHRHPYRTLSVNPGQSHPGVPKLQNARLVRTPSRTRLGPKYDSTTSVTVLSPSGTGKRLGVRPSKPVRPQRSLDPGVRCHSRCSLSLPGRLSRSSRC